MKLSWLSCGFVFCLIISTFAAAADAPIATVPDAVKSITAREIGGHLRFLASDFMKGRDTTSPELRLAGEYLAAHLVGAGAEPLGDQGRGSRSYFQQFPLEIVTPREEGTELSLILELNGSKRIVPCKLGTDFVVFPRGIVAGEIEAPVVFAGYGRIDAERKIDDYEDLDVKDRFVLVYSGQPGSQTNRPRGGGRRMSGDVRRAWASARLRRKRVLSASWKSNLPAAKHRSRKFRLAAGTSDSGRPSMTLGHATASVPGHHLIRLDPRPARRRLRPQEPTPKASCSPVAACVPASASPRPPKSRKTAM